MQLTIRADMQVETGAALMIGTPSERVDKAAATTPQDGRVVQPQREAEAAVTVPAGASLAPGPTLVVATGLQQQVEQVEEVESSAMASTMMAATTTAGSMAQRALIPITVTTTTATAVTPLMASITTTTMKLVHLPQQLLAALPLPLLQPLQWRLSWTRSCQGWRVWR